MLFVILEGLRPKVDDELNYGTLTLANLNAGVKAFKEVSLRRHEIGVLQEEDFTSVESEELRRKLNPVLSPTVAFTSPIFHKNEPHTSIPQSYFSIYLMNVFPFSPPIYSRNRHINRYPRPCDRIFHRPRLFPRPFLVLFQSKKLAE